MTDFFLSPHPDDIAYSCFGPICLSQHKKVIVTVYSVSCYAYNSTKNNIYETTELRRNEEKQFAYRRNAEVIFLNYADSSITMHKSIEETNKMNNRIKQDIQNLIKDYYPCNVYAPIAIGWHVDHINLRDIAVHLFKTNRLLVNKLYLYEDLPYTCDLTTVDYCREINGMTKNLGIRSLVLSELNITLYSGQWHNDIHNYKSQFNLDEYRRMVAYKKKNEQYFERIWEVQD